MFPSPVTISDGSDATSVPDSVAPVTPVATAVQSNVAPVMFELSLIPGDRFAEQTESTKSVLLNIGAGITAIFTSYAPPSQSFAVGITVYTTVSTSAFVVVKVSAGILFVPEGVFPVMPVIVHAKEAPVGVLVNTTPELAVPEHTSSTATGSTTGAGFTVNTKSTGSPIQVAVLGVMV